MLAELNHISSVDRAPIRDRSAKPRRNHLRHGRRHNPLRSIPSTDDVIAFGFELGGFPDPQTLTHATPAFDSQSGMSITGLQTLTNCDHKLIWVKFA